MSRQLRRRCEDRLRDLNLPPDLRSIADLVSHIAGVRHRPIYLHPLTLPPGGPSGAWLGTATTDYVFYERSTSPRHQAQIIAHEIGHMTSGHRSSPGRRTRPAAPGARGRRDHALS